MKQKSTGVAALLLSCVLRCHCNIECLVVYSVSFPTEVAGLCTFCLNDFIFCNLSLFQYASSCTSSCTPGYNPNTTEIISNWMVDLHEAVALKGS